MGEQQFYTVTVDVMDREWKQVIASKSVEIGLRDIHLVQEPMECSYPSEYCSEPGQGRSFLFEANGKEIYLKGANMVPMDYFPDRQYSSDELHWLFNSAIEANYNVLRIWGGGMYLPDEFYEIADRLGILIWQDTMFSCKFYPYTDQRFVDNSALEVKEQVTRL
mmetsp:Transcript_18493/g.28386  ORF Transcript_18493/g.28386 Transcript_18493/m.28386 type:complete len:164 (+) Transcript_18493:1064-1555(+)